MLRFSFFFFFLSIEADFLFISFVLLDEIIQSMRICTKVKKRGYLSVHPEQGTAFSENIYFTVEGKEGTTFFVYADNYTQEKLRFCEKSVGGKRISSHAPRLSFIRAYLLNYIRSFGSQKFSVNHSPSNLPRERFRKSVVDPPPISFRMRICAQGDTHPCNRHAISLRFDS